jgi:diamine N-acetyltransferase
MEPDGQQPAPILNITGDKVALGPLRRDLMPFYQKWFNDFRVTGTMSHGCRPMTWEAEEAWYERASRSENVVYFVIYERATMRPVGGVNLHGIDHRHRTAELGIYVGETDCWGKGYGTEATMLVLDYGFNALGLHNIMLRVFSHNPRAIRAYEKAGFRVIGRRREAHRQGSEVHDDIYMDCLATEFQSLALRRLPEPSSGEG